MVLVNPSPSAPPEKNKEKEINNIPFCQIFKKLMKSTVQKFGRRSFIWMP